VYVDLVATTISQSQQLEDLRQMVQFIFQISSLFRSSLALSPAAQAPMEIRHQNVVAQRGGTHDDFYRLFFFLAYQELESSRSLQPIGGRNTYNAMMPPPPLPLPKVSTLGTPSRAQFQSALPFPAQFGATKLQPGYQSAHLRYDEIRAYLASRAYASGEGAELVAVKALMVTPAPGRKTPTTVAVGSHNLLCFLDFLILALSRTSTRQLIMFQFGLGSKTSKFLHLRFFVPYG
jgi:hypothetical protein